MGHIVEKDWITEAGLRAVCLIIDYNGRQSHRCGYVGIDKDHPLYGIDYSEQSERITQEMVNNLTIGKRGVIIALTASCNSEDDESIRRSPDILFDVHGGLTYSGGSATYPVESDLWWFGFDCNHCDDGNIETDLQWNFDRGPIRTLEYVTDECESLSRQLAQLINSAS